MSEKNDVNYGFDNTLCSVDVSSQDADEIDINRVCEEIDETQSSCRQKQSQNQVLRR